MQTSLLKAMKILDCFSRSTPELSTTEICKKVGMPKTTVIRILETLTGNNFTYRNTSSRKYGIGIEAYKIGSIYLDSSDIYIVATPLVKVINELTEEDVCVYIQDKCNVVMIIKENSKFALSFSTHSGATLPAYATSSGRALLSSLTQSEIDSLYPEEKFIRLTEKTIRNKTELKSELEKIRETGVSIDIEGTFEGIVGVSSLIHDSNCRAIAALTVPVPVFRYDSTRSELLVQLIKAAASLISYRLGCQLKKNAIKTTEELQSYWEVIKAKISSN